MTKAYPQSQLHSPPPIHTQTHRLTEKWIAKLFLVSHFQFSEKEQWRRQNILMPSNILQFTMKTLICNTFWKLFSSLVKNAILTTSATNLKIQQVKSNTSERKRELSSVPPSLNLTPGTLSQILSIYKTPWTFQRTGEKKFNFFRYLTSQHHTLKSHKCMPCTSVR